ncbi:amidase family protein [Mycoplasma sp. SG1]|uniref:amidase family protein n=1 Tax=Mycoplasma sp. SG1 TaxID=2810348 RepID=UPI002024DF65|nr:amidase family protein [Mycoplasma sp. SG1]URM53019.1 Asp-tRNA(Asn)/Glu-tRNA(Gln) amidotransferase subunit GatA [Mycoplasma sp. SG1]
MDFFSKYQKLKPSTNIQKSYLAILDNLDLNGHVSFNYSLINSTNWKSEPKIDNLTDINLQTLYGLSYALKDNFATKDLPMTIGCQFLRNFYPFYNSTVFEKLYTQGAQMICKSNLDELSMAGTGIFSLNGPVKNPWNKLHISGGSSSGSAALVACGAVSFAIGTDTGDSVRKPAAYCGVVGFKPSWGMISRYGLADYAPSLDTVGVFTNSVKDCVTVTNCLIGYDPKDFTTYHLKNKDITIKLSTNKDKKYKFFIFKETDNDDFKDNIKLHFDDLVNNLKAKGHTIEYVSFKSLLLSSLTVCYEIISYAEASSCNSNLLGTTFGENVDKKYQSWFDQIFANRTNYLGSMVKRRFAIGSFVLSSATKGIYFKKAKIIRKIIVHKMEELFKTYDCLIAPTISKPAPLISKYKIDDPFYDHENSSLENQLLISNFCGSPSINIPFKLVNGLPTGIILTADRNEDQKLLSIAQELESIIKFENLLLKNGKA